VRSSSFPIRSSHSSCRSHPIEAGEEDLFETLVSELHQVVPFDGISQLDPGANRVRWQFLEPYKEKLEAMRAVSAFPRDETAAWWVYRNQQPIMIRVGDGGTRFPRVVNWLAKTGLRSLYVLASEFHFGKQPLWPGTLWRRNVVPAIEAAGINKPKLGWHTLRRSYASLLLSSGVSLRVSMELMRHSTAEMTLATYAQTVGDEKREAGEKVASLVLVKKENVA